MSDVMVTKVKNLEPNSHPQNLAVCGLQHTLILQYIVDSGTQISTMQVRLYRFFSIKPIHVFSLPYGFPNVFSSLLYMYMIHIKYKIRNNH